MKKELITRLHKNFEKAVHHQDDIEYWLAREPQIGFRSAWREAASHTLAWTMSR